MSKPRVSLGLPVYNGENYIRKTLESIVAQSFGDFEVIISDNASEDATPDICDEFVRQDSRVRYIRGERNLGAAGNYNRAFREARAEYYKWATHDDVLHENFLELCLEPLDQDDSAALCYPKTTLIDAKDQVLGIFEDRLDLRQERPHQRLGHLVVNIRMCNPAVGLIRREALAKTRLIDKFAGSDFILLVELAMLGKFIEIPEPLFFRREHDERSLRKAADYRELERWFDADYKGGGRFRKIRLFREMVHSVRSIDLTPADRALCNLQIGRWVLKRWRVIGGRYKAALLGKKRPVDDA